jgi:hypothetical protein
MRLRQPGRVALFVRIVDNVANVQKRMIVEYGIELDGVWLPLAMLRRLDEHGPWNVPFAEATTDQARVLLAHGLAERHNTGLARASGLRNFIDALPFAPTDTFSKITPCSEQASGG